MNYVLNMSALLRMNELQNGLDLMQLSLLLLGCCQ